MQYSLLVFEIVFFTTTVISWVSLIRWWVGRRGVWGGGGGWTSWRWTLPAIRPQTVVLCFQWTTGMYTNCRIGSDGHWQQCGTQPILISAPQQPKRTSNAPTWLYRVSKSQLWKQTWLSIATYVVNASWQCMSVSLILGLNLDFSSCDILVGFCKSSHIFIYLINMVGWHQSIACTRLLPSTYIIHTIKAVTERHNRPYREYMKWHKKQCLQRTSTDSSWWKTAEPVNVLNLCIFGII